MIFLPAFMCKIPSGLLVSMYPDDNWANSPCGSRFHGALVKYGNNDVIRSRLILCSLVICKSSVLQIKWRHLQLHNLEQLYDYLYTVNNAVGAIQ